MEFENKEWSFLIHLCSSFLEVGSIKENIFLSIPSNFDWDKFYELAANHRVLSVVYDQLISNKELVPKPIIRRLSIYFRERTKYNLTLTSELLDLLKVFKNEDLSIVPYKGVILSHFIYGNLGTRPTADIDIMVLEKDLDNIELCLSKAGYKTPKKLADRLKESHRKYNCEISISRKINGRDLSIDTHWKIANKMLQMDVGFNEMKKHSSVEDFFGTPINLLKPEALLIITAMHHMGKEKMVHLKQVIDLAMILKKNEAQIRWEEVVRLSKEWKVYKLTLYSLLLLKDTLNASIPEAIEEMIDQNCDSNFISSIINSFPLSKGKYADNVVDDFKRGIELHLKIRDDFRTKFKIVLYHLITISTPNILDFKEAEEIGFLKWYLATALKPFRLIKNYIKS